MIKTLSSKTIYKGHVINVKLDTVRENDIEYEREVVVHKGSAVIVPVFEDETVALVRQYRHAAEKYLLEIPAGSLDGDESPQTGAERELEEEVGVTAANLDLLAEFYVSPGFLTERMHVFLATGLTKTAQNLETDEIIEIERYTFTQALEMIRNGEIEDAKTIAGLMLAGAKYGISF